MIIGLERQICASEQLFDRTKGMVLVTGSRIVRTIMMVCVVLVYVIVLLMSTCCFMNRRLVERRVGSYFRRVERERYMDFARERFIQSEGMVERRVEERKEELGMVEEEQREMMLRAYRRELEI